MPKILNPTGIIRTLTSLNDAGLGERRYRLSLDQLEQGKIPAILISLDGMPRHEVLHIYLIVNGHIDVRLNIASYQPGHVAKCWDNKYREPRYWAECTGPVSRPPEPLPWRGFQGIRYTEDLW